jgi:hypothetical protein
MNTGILIFETAARVCDGNAVAGLLGMIPAGDEVAPFLGEKFHAHRYDLETKCLYCLASDGNVALCITVAGACMEQASEIVDWLGEGELGAEVVAQITAWVTGGPVSLVSWPMFMGSLRSRRQSGGWEALGSRHHGHGEGCD